MGGSSVFRTLSRRVYLGVAHWGERENLHAHAAIVDQELWDAAQRRPRGYRQPRRSEDVALLSGIARCAGCRFTISRALSQCAGGSRQFYRCRVTRVSGRCRAPAAIRGDHADGLEAYVEVVVCAELERRAGTFTAVSDVESIRDAAEASQRARTISRRCATTPGRGVASARGGCRLWSRWSRLSMSPSSGLGELRAAHADSAVAGLTADAYRSLGRAERAEVLARDDRLRVVRNAGPDEGATRSRSTNGASDPLARPGA